MGKIVFSRLICDLLVGDGAGVSSSKKSKKRAFHTMLYCVRVGGGTFWRGFSESYDPVFNPIMFASTIFPIKSRRQ